MKTFERIRQLVAQIPRGKVATYSQVAQLAGLHNAKVVGWALRNNQNPKIPCHRVIKKDGTLAEGYSLGGWQNQKYLLKKEEIHFTKPNQVDLNEHLWQPQELSGLKARRVPVSANCK